MLKPHRSGPTIDSQKLSTADVEGFSLSGAPAHLIDCDLEGAELAGLDLTGWQFERCVLRQTDLTGAIMEYARFQSCRGAFCLFAGADLTDAVFSSSDFNNAVFRGATLTSASFRCCKLTGADLTETKPLEVRIEECLLINAKLSEFSFYRQTLKKIDFAQSDLRKCDFRSAVLDGCSLRDADISDARFEGADLRDTDLGGLRLTDAARFRGATISKTQAGQLLGELGLKVG